MTFEELKQEFIDRGFQVDGDSFVCETEDLNTTINGVHPKQRFEMTYIYEGWVKDAGDSDSDDGEPIYEFNVLGQNKEPVTIICIGSFNDFVKLVGWRG